MAFVCVADGAVSSAKRKAAKTPRGPTSVRPRVHVDVYLTRKLFACCGSENLIMPARASSVVRPRAGRKRPSNRFSAGALPSLSRSTDLSAFFASNNVASVCLAVSERRNRTRLSFPNTIDDPPFSAPSTKASESLPAPTPSEHVSPSGRASVTCSPGSSLVSEKLGRPVW